MIKDILETGFSIIYKKDGNFIVIHECVETTNFANKKTLADKTPERFLIYSFCNKEGKIIKQNFSKKEDKFQLENIEKSAKIPLKYLLWVKKNIRITNFKYKVENINNKVCYTHSLGFTMYFDNSDLENIDITKEFHNTKCENIIHYNILDYNPVVKCRNISIKKKSSTVVDSIIYKDFYNDVKVMFLEDFYKDYKIKFKLKSIKDKKREEKLSGDILTFNSLEMLIEVELDIKYKSYYKIGQKSDNKILLRGNGLQINDKTNLLNLYNPDFNNHVIKILSSIDVGSVIIYLDKGSLYIRITSSVEDSQQLQELQQALKKLPMSDILCCLIDYIKEKDLENS